MSVCLNAGVNESWMADARDLAGAPRILNSLVDLGAYETAAELPTVSVEPLAQTLRATQTVTFCATATGTPPLSYQWLKDGLSLPADPRISGITSACLTVANLRSNDAGAYTVLVTNWAGAVASAPASQLVVLVPPHFVFPPNLRPINRAIPSASKRWRRASRRGLSLEQKRSQTLQWQPD